MPFVYWTMAPGAGQATRQPGLRAVHALVLPHQPAQAVLARPRARGTGSGSRSSRSCRGASGTSPSARSSRAEDRSTPGTPPRTPCSRCTSTCRRASTRSAAAGCPAPAPRRRRCGEFRESPSYLLSWGPTPLASRSFACLALERRLSRSACLRLTLPSPVSRGIPCTPARTNSDRPRSGSRGWRAIRAACRGPGSPSESGTRSGTSSSRPPSSA